MDDCEWFLEILDAGFLSLRDVLLGNCLVKLFDSISLVVSMVVVVFNLVFVLETAVLDGVDVSDSEYLDTDFCVLDIVVPAWPLVGFEMVAALANRLEFSCVLLLFLRSKGVVTSASASLVI